MIPTRSVVFLCFAIYLVHCECASSFRKCRNAFEWQNDTVKAIASQVAEDEIVVDDFKTRTTYRNLSNYKVILFGDSLDLHSCFYLESFNTTGTTHMKAKITSYPVNCYRDEHLDFQYYRFSGILDYAGKVKGNPSFVKTIGKRKPDAIVFSSFAWDLLNNQQHYCAQDDNLKSCLCNYRRMRLPECIAVSNHHDYNRLVTPWCDKEFLTSWRTTLLKVVRELAAAFPEAKIYVRTQPFGSTLIMGNMACQGAMNNIIQEIGESLLPLDHGGKLCRTLNMNALFAQVAHLHMGHANDPKAPNDGLHYFNVANVWSNYLINTIVDNAAD